MEHFRQDCRFEHNLLRFVTASTCSPVLWLNAGNTCQMFLCMLCGLCITIESTHAALAAENCWGAAACKQDAQTRQPHIARWCLTIKQPLQPLHCLHCRAHLSDMCATSALQLPCLCNSHKTCCTPNSFCYSLLHDTCHRCAIHQKLQSNLYNGKLGCLATQWRLR